tara:strand:+ start:29 stop:718 length:690 start_codon:yes stop_codon:yes gene_type:complete
MAKSKLSSAYKAAASSSGSYKASLYDIENIGYKRSSSAQLAGIKAQDKNRMVGMLSEGIDMAGNVMRRSKRMKEEGAAAESLGAKKIDRSLWGKLTGEDQMYEKVGEGGEMGTVSGSDVMAEYKLQQQYKAFGKSATVDETTGKATSTPAPKVAPVIPEVKTDKSLAQETGIVDKKQAAGPTQSGKVLGVPQTSQGEIDKFNKSKAGTKLQKDLSKLFDDDFSNYGFGG